MVQHRACHTGREEDARHLTRLLRNPIWLIAIGGDFVGFLLNIAALSTGPVVVIRPLVVLMLPVALMVSWRLGGPQPRAGEWLGSAAISAGLFTSWRALVPLLAVLALGAGGIILTQVSFLIGHLAATLPANLSADPLTAVLIGALLLREHLPLSRWHPVGYIACLALATAGTMRLARRAEEPASVLEPAAKMGG